VAFSPDGKRIASGSADKTVRVWDTLTGRPTWTLQGHTEAVYAVAFSPDGALIASGAADKTIRLWNVATGENDGTLQHTDGVRDLAFSADGQFLASTENFGGSITLWNPSSRASLATLRVVAAQDAIYLFTPTGHVDFGGPVPCSARALAACRIGTHTLPFDVCEERFYSPDLLAKILTGDRSYLEPESESPPLDCPVTAPPGARP